jgi:hypothetical protein
MFPSFDGIFTRPLEMVGIDSPLRHRARVALQFVQDCLGPLVLTTAPQFGTRNPTYLHLVAKSSLRPMSDDTRDKRLNRGYIIAKRWAQIYNSAALHCPRLKPGVSLEFRRMWMRGQLGKLARGVP